ncbi:hypothetical protein MVEN_01659100 [Mycena venus]|uniref:NAD(P)-binding protein n=1 Tax=Mycena venus TaxID=2733690 RepID=A0A8H7CP46_9AGAR|nr:hypothetical protein MVEN_01659100 [Mycena venus]
MAPLIAFIIGAGQNVGEHTAAALKAKGYQVAVGSRKPDIEQRKKEGYFPVVIDATNPDSVKTAFAQVNKELGPPNVVIFNASHWVSAAVPEDPLTLSLEGLKEQMDVTLAAYAAAQEALQGFRSETHKDGLKTFIITGNPLPWVPADTLPLYFGVYIQKTILWRFTEFFANAYAKEQARFYFVTLVGKAGGVIDDLSHWPTSGPQHAQVQYSYVFHWDHAVNDLLPSLQVYLDLITREDQTDWDYRFTVDGKKWTK